MYRMRVAVLLATLAASPTLAQDVPFSPDATEACLAALAEGGSGVACIGKSADTCIATDAGSSNVGMSSCWASERDYWDARLNTAYDALLATAEADDAELAALGSAAEPQAPALRDTQRAWLAYRDAACYWETTRWGGGSGAGPAGVQCLMQLTGEQALRLEVARQP